MGKKMTKAERRALKEALEAEEKLRLEIEERERLERERIALEERAARETLVKFSIHLSSYQECWP